MKTSALVFFVSSVTWLAASCASARPLPVRQEVVPTAKAAPAEASPSGSPADHLPTHIKRLTQFGERPDWSHDGKRILFLSKVFGDVYEYDLETGSLIPVTLHFRHYGFTRALYLPGGDILLSGPRAPFDERDRADRERARNGCELSVLSRTRRATPTPLGVLASEGPAVSRNRMRIAWAETWRQRPDELKDSETEIFVAELTADAGTFALTNKRKVLDSRQMGLRIHSLETQNFVPPHDEALTVTVYGFQGTETYLLDLKTGVYTNQSQAPNDYDEAEGIFPDGLSTAVESAPSRGSAWPLVDVYRLWLDGSGRKQQLTRFTDYPGYKAAQPIVSDDGRSLVFQMGRSGDEAGEGHGLFLLDLGAVPAVP